MQRISGFAQEGSTTLLISGAAGSIARKVQGSYPLATITVYDAGTLNLASIYSDDGVTPKANPFVSSLSAQWFFYAANGVYDIKFSGAGIAAPFTLGDFTLFDPEAGVGSASYIIDQIARDFPSVKRYGAKGDGIIVYDGVMLNGSAALSSASGLFTADMVGRGAVVIGAGPSSATLSTTVLSYTSPTQITLAASASTPVTNVVAQVATDDTVAIAAAHAANKQVFYPRGIYGCTTIRLYQGQRIFGAGIDNVAFIRLGAGAGNAFMAMVSGQTAENMRLENFVLWCNSIGSNLNGLELGTQTPGTTNYASASIIQSVRVLSASGINCYLYSNAGRVRDLWLQNAPTTGLPTTLSAPNTMGLKVEGTTLEADGLYIEGRYELAFMNSGAAGSTYNLLHLEIGGNAYPASDIIDLTAGDQMLVDIEMISLGAYTRRDLIRFANGVEFISLKKITVDSSGGAVTATNEINDITQGVTLPVQAYIKSYYSLDSANSLVDDIFTKMRFNRAVSFTANVDITKSLPTLTLYDTDGTHPFRLANDNESLILHDITNGLDVLTIAAGGAASFLSSLAAASLAIAGQAITWGTYTPTLAHSLNIAASTAYLSQYTRIGAMVIVSGMVDVDPTAAGQCTLGISLPIASAFTALEDCGGTASYVAVAGNAGGIQANIANDRADLSWVATDTANRSMPFVFMYRIK